MKNGIVKINNYLSMLGANLAMIDLSAMIPSTKPDEASIRALAAAEAHGASLWVYGEGVHGKPQDNVQVPSGKLVLSEDRYVYKPFRALSQTFLRNRGLDFSRPGVLEASVEMLKGRTIYANHQFRDIDNWRGVISDSFWDAEGKDTNGIPGINVNCKIDAFLNYRTACGVMMEPPSINAASVTVICEVEFSHLDLVKDGTFWNYFLEEKDGEIVRLIATKIIEYWEMSFVFLGEDRTAKGLPGESENDQGAATLEARINQPASQKLTATEKKMKITEENKTLLGITAEGDDVPEQTVLDAAIALANANKVKPTELAALSLKATEGEKLLGEKRNEVLRLAKLAELGADEGTLNPVLEKMINEANAEELVSLETLYREKVGAKLPKDGQSSLENSDEIEDAGNVKNKDKKPVKTVNVGNLHD